MPHTLPSQAYESNHLDLSREQSAAILAAGAEFVLATALGRQVQLDDLTLKGAATKSVYGSYVSLKRGKHLRGCCGGLRPSPQPIMDAIFEGAHRTVLDDPRFPVVSPCELPFLDLEVWLLFNPQPVTAKGEERAEVVVTGGKHGLLVTRGPQVGLLLPGVAVDRGWDSRTFLDQVCVKAGMHPSLWKDDATALVTFEGDVLTGKLSSYIDGQSPAPAPFLSEQDVIGYGELCQRNILALMQGATPFYSHPGLRDGYVTGVSLSLRLPDRPTSIEFTQLSMRPGLALQATLFGLTQNAARHLLNISMPLEMFVQTAVGVAVFTEPMVQGSVADPDLRGFDPKQRAFILFERGKQGIIYRPDKSAQDVLAEGAQITQVMTPAACSVLSLAVQTKLPGLAFSNAPRPQAGPATRPPALAGRFYPDDATALGAMVTQMMGERSAKPTKAVAAMTPHAGLIYSGQLAANVLKGIEIPKTVIVIGPKHTALGMEWAIAPHETWTIPGTTLKSDPELAKKLVDAIPGLSLDAAAHQQEHAIEVELPFIARLAPDAKVVGIAVGHADFEGCQRFAQGLAKVVGAMKDPPLLVISSDMNHFATDEQTRLLDEMALAAMDTLDPEELYLTVSENNISMCGVMPAVIVMETLRILKRLNSATRVGYATSADVTGDKSRVVGYAGMLFR